MANNKPLSRVPCIGVSLVLCVGMVLIGLEVHRDAATHANALRRKANRLLILFIQ
jgi:hypothetical protein